MEPAEQYDYVDVPWYRVSDLTINTHRGSQRLIGCSFNSTMVGLFYITLRNVRPFSEDPDFTTREQAVSIDGNPYAGVGASRSNLAAVAAANQLPPEAAMRRVNLNDSAVAMHNGGRPPGGEMGVGQSNSGGRGSDRGSGASSAGRMQSSGQSAGSHPMLPPVSLYAPSGSVASGSNRYAGVSATASQEFAGSSDSGALDHSAASRAASGQAACARPSMVSIGVGVGDSLVRGQAEAGPDLLRAQQQQLPRQRPFNDRQPRDPALDIPAYPRMQQQPRVQSPPDPQGGPDQRYSWESGTAHGGAAVGPSGIDRRGSGHCDGYSAGGGSVQYTSAGPADLEAATALQSGHAMFAGTMKKRAHTLSLVRNFVAKVDWRGAISCARRCDDSAAFADLLEAMYERRDAFNLELVNEVRFNPE